MSPEEKARLIIDEQLKKSGWIIQDMKELNLSAGQGVAVREFPTSTGPVDYALFVDGAPVGVAEAKKEEKGEDITTVESQSARYANSTFKWMTGDYSIRFAYECTGQLTRFTDYKDIKFRSRSVFSFHRPETLAMLLKQSDTLRNNMKHFPELDTEGFRDCQIRAISNLDKSFAENRPKALVQMATGSGKTFTAITAAYRLLKYAKMNRILFLVDTKSLGEQAEREFLAYIPNDDHRPFSNIYGVYRLKSSRMPENTQIYISTIQRMYSILKGEELDEVAEEGLEGIVTPESKAPKEVVYNEKYPPEFFDCIIVDECHRSIYNVWNQVLEYFDSFIIGLTATPDKRTFAFFNQNVVSEYPREQAIIDGVNVGEDIFLIETEVGRNGAHLMKQLIEYEQPTKYIVESTEYDDSYKTPVLTAGKSFILGYTSETEGIFEKADLPVIIFDDFTTSSQYVNFPFKVKSSAMKILRVNKELVLPKYIYYRMQIIQFDHSTHKRYWIQQYSKIKVRIPSIDEQKKVINQIEELFSELDDGISTLLKTKEELKVYRQAVLKEAFSRIEGDRYTVSDVCDDIKVGIVIKPSQYYTTEENGIKAFRSANVREFHIDDCDWVYLNKAGQDANKRSELHEGDVLVVRTGYPGTACVVTKKFEGCNAIDVLIACPKKELILPEFLCAFTNSPLGKAFVEEKKRGVGQKHFNVGGYSKMELVLPSKDIQKRIVLEIENKLSVCENIEKTVDEALAQAEAMRQSILKKAFEGRLV